MLFPLVGNSPKFGIIGIIPTVLNAFIGGPAFLVNLSAKMRAVKCSALKLEIMICKAKNLNMQIGPDVSIP